MADMKDKTDKKVVLQYSETQSWVIIFVDEIQKVWCKHIFSWSRDPEDSFPNTQETKKDKSKLKDDATNNECFLNISKHSL